MEGEKAVATVSFPEMYQVWPTKSPAVCPGSRLRLLMISDGLDPELN
jgi:hypothetical protein